MKKYDRMAVKLDEAQTRTVEAVLRTAGETELADKFLAKFAKPETGPRLVKVRSDESRKIFETVETERVPVSELTAGDACVLQGQVKFFVSEVTEDAVKFVKKTQRKGGRKYTKYVTAPKFTRIVG